jgi:hypothetical protein
MAYIDVDMDDFSDDELIDEMRKRGIYLTKLDEIMPIFTAMQLNKQEEAWELMRTYVCDKTGRVI